MSQAQLENKVAGYLRDSLALENYRQHPITAKRLQTEMDRMARDTKQSEVLRELFEALGNDAAVIAECLARPILAERLIADLSAQGQTRHVESPQTEALRTMPVPTTLGQVVYALPEIANACTDQWGATSTSNAPSARKDTIAVWTGSEMVVWGGWNAGGLNTGAKYNPSTDSWTATSTNNAPSVRQLLTAVWTGSEMIVWGGADNSGSPLKTGGRYNPGMNTWTATTTINAPDARAFHTAVWTGSEMIVWAGENQTFALLNTGAKYNPSTDSWTATSTNNAPSAREQHTAVWAGSEMIVWAGFNFTAGRLKTGAKYNPSTDSWTATSTTNAPDGRVNHTAVWTGSEMMVWGGYNATVPLNTGGTYDPSTNSWTATSTTNAPTGRYNHTAVWTGGEVIIWGGYGGSQLNTGGRYNPATNSWTATSTTNAPAARSEHAAVWTGSEMIVWGGAFANGPHQFLRTGGRYCGQYTPSLTIIQPNGGEVWAGGSVQQIKWDSNKMKHSDHLILQYSRDGGVSWFRIAQDIPAFAFGYWWQVDNFATTQGRVKILLQENLSVTDQSDANFTVQRTP